MKSVLLDTNLLLLLIVGNLEPSKLGQVRRVKQYDPESFEILNRILGEFHRHVSLPNVLTETSNLLGLGDREIVVGATSAFARYCQLLDEIYEESRDLVSTRAFAKFGLTDSAIGKLGAKGVTVLTDDAPLFGYLSNLGLKPINFSHHRTPPP